MYLAGQILVSEHNYRRALDIYEMATSSPDDAPGGKSAYLHSLGDIWKAISRLKIKLGDQVGAQAAIRTCALQYDDPVAYHELAKAYTPRWSKDYEDYMLKAAASGNTKAAHELGVLYYKQSRGRISTSPGNISSGNTKTLEDLREQNINKGHGTVSLPPKMSLEKATQAREWLAIGAESGIPMSQLYLAILLRAVGKSDEALEWLKKVSSSKRWTPAILWLRSMWTREDPIDIDTAWERARTAEKTELMAGGEKIAITD